LHIHREPGLLQMHGITILHRAAPASTNRSAADAWHRTDDRAKRL